MKHIASSLVTAALATSLLACGGEPTAPKGPSGGENRFRAAIDGEMVDFEAVGLEIESRFMAPLILRTSGSADPIKEAVDDEYSLQLELHLDREQLLASSAGAELTIEGISSFEAADNQGQRPAPTYTPGMSNAEAVRGVAVSKSCFCTDMDSGEQRFTGTLRVLQISQTEITAELTLEMTGAIPNHNDIQSLSLSAELNLAIPEDPMPQQ